MNKENCALKLVDEIILVKLMKQTSKNQTANVRVT